MSEPIVFLFGAGASNGATHVLTTAPPLGRDLYDELAVRFPKKWGAESPLNDYANDFRKDFEKTMTKEICGWHPTLTILEAQREMALYFAGFNLDGSGKDLYSRLLDWLQRAGKLEQTTFGSLNYECLFEQAACNRGYRIDYDCCQSLHGTVRVLKVHGSCNFLTQDLGHWRAHLTTPNSSLECEVQFLTPVSTHEHLSSKFSNREAYHYPVMSLYSSFKTDLLAPLAIQNIRNKWVECVSNASLVVTVGVRPVKADTHVWEPVLETQARCAYIGAQSDLEAWPEVNSKCEFVAARFEEFDRLERLLGC